MVRIVEPVQREAAVEAETSSHPGLDPDRTTVPDEPSPLTLWPPLRWWQGMRAIGRIV